MRQSNLSEFVVESEVVIMGNLFANENKNVKQTRKEGEEPAKTREMKSGKSLSDSIKNMNEYFADAGALFHKGWNNGKQVKIEDVKGMIWRDCTKDTGTFIFDE